MTEGIESTGATLIRLVKATRKTLDLTAMYWALSPNHQRRDSEGFTMEELLHKYGGQVGKDLYDALDEAAGRGVKIRVINGPGFDPTDDESGDLAKKHPNSIEIRDASMPDWYGSGIMHQKIWIFDHEHIYIGSANNDWKSLTQVKEMGVCVENDAAVAAEMTGYFEAWWIFADPQRKPATVRVQDAQVGIQRMVPNWSDLVPAESRADNPLDQPATQPGTSWDQPQPFGEGEYFISGAPRELCVGGRTPDEEALVRTIREAEHSVSVSVMDFAPVSLYRGEYDREKRKCYLDNGQVATPVWWSALFDAVLYAVTTKAVHVRLLVSEWEHSSAFLTPYLQALRQAAKAGQASATMVTGRLEIRRFVCSGGLPDRDSVSVALPRGTASPEHYPGHTRVNHTKYIVTDKRFNIGTSNMTYDYFSGTAGSSFNSTREDLRAQLQAVFDRDWQSQYAECPDC